MTLDPIYLLDFRHGKVVELDPETDVRVEDRLEERGLSEPPQPDITFAALGSPVESKD